MASRKDSNEDDPQNENLKNDSDDSFGLPEIQYEPIRRNEPVDEPVEEVQASASPYQQEEEHQPEESEVREEYYEEEQPQESDYREEPPAYTYQREEEEASLWPKILGVVVIILVALAVTWYFALYKPKQDEAAAQARIVAEQQAAVQKQKEAEEARIRLEREAVEKRRLDSLALLKTPAIGIIETLNARTGRYYVVIASAVDSDLLMDYAKKLTANGVSSKIIPPFGRHKVSRLTIAEGDTFAEAAEKSEPLKAEFGDAVWVLKY
jgi:cbb3-type cytochrome oxidase subunit 3